MEGAKPYARVMLHQLKIRPCKHSINLKQVMLNCIFHREHYIIHDPCNSFHEPKLPGKLSCHKLVSE